MSLALHASAIPQIRRESGIVAVGVYQFEKRSGKLIAPDFWLERRFCPTLIQENYGMREVFAEFEGTKTSTYNCEKFPPETSLGRVGHNNKMCKAACRMNPPYT